MQHEAHTEHIPWTMHLQDDECDEKIEDFTPDDILVDPDRPLRTGDFLQIIYPDANHAEGVVESPKRTTLLRGSQTAEQDQTKGLI